MNNGRYMFYRESTRKKRRQEQNKDQLLASHSTPHLCSINDPLLNLLMLPEYKAVINHFPFFYFPISLSTCHNSDDKSVRLTIQVRGLSDAETKRKVTAFELSLGVVSWTPLLRHGQVRFINKCLPTPTFQFTTKYKTNKKQNKKCPLSTDFLI